MQFDEKVRNIFALERERNKKKIVKELFPFIEPSFDFYRIRCFLNVVTETII